MLRLHSDIIEAISLYLFESDVFCWSTTCKTFIYLKRLWFQRVKKILLTNPFVKKAIRCQGVVSVSGFDVLLAALGRQPEGFPLHIHHYGSGISSFSCPQKQYSTHVDNVHTFTVLPKPEVLSCLDECQFGSFSGGRVIGLNGAWKIMCEKTLKANLYFSHDMMVLKKFGVEMQRKWNRVLWKSEFKFTLHSMCEMLQEVSSPKEEGETIPKSFSSPVTFLTLLQSLDLLESFFCNWRSGYIVYVSVQQNRDVIVHPDRSGGSSPRSNSRRAITRTNIDFSCCPVYLDKRVAVLFVVLFDLKRV